MQSKHYACLSGISKLTIALLLLAPFHWPYSYYIFLRWFVLLSTLAHIGFSIWLRRPLCLLIFVPIGLLFNPIEPIYFSKDNWAIIDFVAAILILVGYEELTKV